MQVLGNGRIVTEHEVVDPGWIEIRGDRVNRVGSTATSTPADVDLAGQVVVPGFVDTHVHGGGGSSYLTGEADQARRVAEFHLAHGTTTTYASLITARAEDLQRQIAALVELAEEQVLAGIHLEGPWLAEARCGAHEPGLLRPPVAEEVDRLVASGRGAIRMVTLAPELDGGLDTVRRLVDAGVTVAVGHTDAPYEVVREALDAGAGVGTHLFNAMPPIHHRAPGPVPALLEDPRGVVELVADGIHLHASVVTLAVRAAGADRVCLVTDAMTAAGMSDGPYELGGLTVRVHGGVARLAESGSIAGSTLTMDTAFRFAVTHAGLSLVDAARAAATNPARAHGLADVGALSPGHLADLVVLDDALRVTGVMRRGSWVPGDGREIH